MVQMSPPNHSAKPNHATDNGPSQKSEEHIGHGEQSTNVFPRMFGQNALALPFPERGQTQLRALEPAQVAPQVECKDS
jgi:hypothetical protein